MSLSRAQNIFMPANINSIVILSVDWKANMPSQKMSEKLTQTMFNYEIIVLFKIIS